MESSSCHFNAIHKWEKRLHFPKKNWGKVGKWGIIFRKGRRLLFLFDPPPCILCSSFILFCLSRLCDVCSEQSLPEVMKYDILVLIPCNCTMIAALFEEIILVTIKCQTVTQEKKAIMVHNENVALKYWLKSPIIL